MGTPRVKSESLSIRLRSGLSGLSLRRIVTSNQYIPEVDGFRFLAILVVVVSHIYVQCGPIPGGGTLAQAFASVFHDGKRGVYLFFTISGFIMALPFARQHLQQGARVSLKSYFRRRVTRLEPPYLLAMTLRLGIMLFYKNRDTSSMLLHYLASILYLHNWIFKAYSTINPPAWSLEIEIQFYLLAPLLASVFLIRNRYARRSLLLIAILILGFVGRFVLAQDGRLALTVLHYANYFLAGFFLCDLYLTEEGDVFPPLLWDIVGIASLACILLLRAEWFPVVVPLATIALYMAGFHGRILRSFFALRPVSLIGGACYSIYLTHSTVLSAMNAPVRRISNTSLPVSLQDCLIFGGCLVAALAVGLVYFLAIERPCMDPQWPRKLAIRFGWRNQPVAGAPIGQG